MSKPTRSVAPTDMAAAAATQGATQQNETTVAAARPAAIIATPTQTKSANVQQFERLCQAYLDNKTGSKEPRNINGQERTYAHRSILAFGSIINFVWAHQDDNQVLMAYRRFMAEHYTDYLSATEALQGMNFVKSEIERDRYSIMYMLMYEIVNASRSRVDYNYERATKVCQNPNCPIPNGFVQFIASRMR